MAHSPMRDRLVAIASSNAGDPGGFLEDLSDLHDDWHREFVRSYGFLLFHTRVVRYFNTIVNAQLQPPVAAYTANDLQGMGIAPFGGNLANVDTLAELVSFSNAIESWHNTAHGRLRPRPAHRWGTRARTSSSGRSGGCTCTSTGSSSRCCGSTVTANTQVSS